MTKSVENFPLASQQSEHFACKYYACMAAQLSLTQTPFLCVQFYHILCMCIQTENSEPKRNFDMCDEAPIVGDFLAKGGQ